MERPLESSTNVEQLKAEWAKDKFYTSCLKLVKLEYAVVVNYNVAFRMSTGIAEANTTFYVTKDTTVAHLLSEVRPGPFCVSAPRSRFPLTASVSLIRSRFWPHFWPHL